MRKFLFVVLLFCSAELFAQKQYVIHEAGLVITLPNENWKTMPVKRPNQHIFRRANAKDTTGRKIFPEVVISIEPVKPYTPLTEYSVFKQTGFAERLKNYKVEKTFTNSDGMLKMSYAIGNKARYEDEEGVKHTFYFIHLVEETKGVQILIEVPSAGFPLYEEELTSIIRSLEYK